MSHFYHYLIVGQLPYRGLTQTMTTIAGKEGVKGLFQGFSPYYLRCGGQTLLMFLSVEWLRKTYQSIKQIPSYFFPSSLLSATLLPLNLFHRTLTLFLILLFLLLFLFLPITSSLSLSVSFLYVLSLYLYKFELKITQFCAPFNSHCTHFVLLCLLLPLTS